MLLRELSICLRERELELVRCKRGEYDASSDLQ